MLIDMLLWSSESHGVPVAPSGSALDEAPDPKDVPEEIVTEILRQLEVLCREWDAMYPENPIESREGDDD